jgi:hypothetical protein
VGVGSADEDDHRHIDHYPYPCSPRDGQPRLQNAACAVAWLMIVTTRSSGYASGVEDCLGVSGN